MIVVRASGERQKSLPKRSFTKTASLSLLDPKLPFTTTLEAVIRSSRLNDSSVPILAAKQAAAIAM